MNNFSVLIVGCGSLGTKLLKLLQKQNFSSIGVISSTSILNTQVNFDKIKVEIIKINSNTENIKILDIKWDVVIYTLGYWEGKNNDIVSMYKNLDPLVNFFSNIKIYPTKIIYISSSAVYYDDNYSDDIDLDKIPLSSYGVSKIYSERILSNFCMNKNIKYIIIRPFHIASDIEMYNPGKSHVLTDFIYKKINNIPIIQKENFKNINIPFTWVDDVSEAIINCITKINTNMVINIGNRRSYSLESVLLMIAEYFDKEKIDINSYMYQGNKYFQKSYKFLGDYDVTNIDIMLIKIITNLRRVNNGNI